MRCMDRHHKGDNRRGLVILSLMQGEYEASKGLARIDTETLRRSGGRGGGAHTRTARAVVTRARPPEPAASRAC